MKLTAQMKVKIGTILGRLVALMFWLAMTLAAFYFVIKYW